MFVIFKKKHNYTTAVWDHVPITQSAGAEFPENISQQCSFYDDASIPLLKGLYIYCYRTYNIFSSVRSARTMISFWITEDVYVSMSKTQIHILDQELFVQWSLVLHLICLPHTNYVDSCHIVIWCCILFLLFFWLWLWHFGITKHNWTQRKSFADVACTNGSCTVFY